MGRAYEYRKARKMKRWGTMAKIFTRVGREITMAVKTGGPDPQVNSRLRMIIQNAKTANMPKETVERAIKKALAKDQTDYKEILYEGYGPHGIAILVETATDNSTRTVSNVRSYFNKYHGSLGTSGSVSFMFDHRCIFNVSTEKQVDVEELELELIDFGAEEVFAEENYLIISAEFEAFGPLQKYFEENGYEINSVEFERLPSQMKQLSESEAEDLEKFLIKFEEDDDVTNVFHNMTV